MVGPLKVLKILHCRNLKLAKAAKSSEKHVTQKVESSRAPGASGPEVSRNETINVSEDMRIKLCRVCLRQGIISIFGNKSVEDLASALKTIGGVEVTITDSYPKYLCQSCHALLQGAILFRKTAQQSDKKLKQPRIETYDDSIFTDDNDNEEPHEIEDHKQKFRMFFTCTRCDIKFTSQQEYDNHLISSEHENKLSMCPICKNVYTPQYLKRHMTYHQEEISYICDVCGKHFVRQEHFSRHHLTHFFSLPFKCSLCPYKGRFRESLKMHMRKHTGEKPYQCEQCPRRFTSKSNLNKHALTHKGTRDFWCEICGRGFYTKRELEMHFKVVHAGIKEHICPICDKAFGYRKHMMKHQLKVHKREKLLNGRTPIYIQVERMKEQGD